MEDAIYKQDFDLISSLIDQGACPDYLGLACRLKNLDLVTLLLNKGADVNCQYHEDAPITISVQKGPISIVELLIKYNADLNLNNGEPLLTAVKQNNIQLIKLLLPRVSIITKQQVFRWMTRNRRSFTFNLLNLFLQDQTEDLINGQYDNGNTLLHEFAVLGSITMVNFLLEHGAKHDITNKAGLTPKQLIQQQLIETKLTNPYREDLIQSIIELFEEHEFPIIKNALD